METENDNNEDDFEEQLIKKIKKFYESNPPLTSHDELDKFLSSIDLLEIWDSQEEKETLWESLSKYMVDSKIDCEGAIKGIKDLLNGDLDEAENENNDKEMTQKEKFISRVSRISRLSNSGAAGMTSGPVNKLALNKYKQRAIEEYDSLDDDSLIQFKKIFALLKLSKTNSKIKYDELNEICNKHKFIKIQTEDLWKYLSFCVYEEDLKTIIRNKEFNINNEILEEVKEYIDQKIINEDLDYDSDNLDKDEEDSVSSDGRKKFKEEDPLMLIGKIIKQTINTNENNGALVDIKNEIRKINNNMVDCGYHILNKDVSTMDDMNKNKDLMNEKIFEIEEFVKNSRNENENNINKMQLLKEKIISTKENIKIMEKDYKELLEKYNNNQEIDIDEETERLLDENMMLSQEKENKEQEIQNLLEEKKNLRKDYQALLSQYEDAIKEKNEVTQEASQLKIDNYKIKNDYDKLLNDIMNKVDKTPEKEKKTKKKDKKEDKKDEKKTMSYEEQIKEINIINKSPLDDGEKIIKKKNILKEMANEKLISYIMEIDKINQTLTNERSQKEQKIYEINQKNVDLKDQLNKMKESNVVLEEENKNMQKRIEDLTKDVQNNEMFRPSIAMNSQMRISRLSKLNAAGINERKFNKAAGVGFSIKKSVQTFKLKDINNNAKNNAKGQKTKFENISFDLYGVKEVDNEEEDQENKNNTNENKNELTTSNQSGLAITNNSTKKNEMSISNNNDINLSGSNQKNSNNNNLSINTSEINISGENKNNINLNAISSNNTLSIDGNKDKKLELATGSSNMEIAGNNNKGFELSTNSSNIEISGQNKTANNSIENSIEFNINKQINENVINADSNAVIEVENIKDINLAIGDSINFKGKDPNEENDNKNKDDIIFEKENSNLFIKKQDKNNNDSSHITSISFFETKPQAEKNISSTIIKKENNNEEDISGTIPSVKFDNLIGNLIDGDSITKNENNVSNITKNTNNLANLTKNESNVLNLSKNANNISNISTNANNISNISTNVNNISNISTNANNLANISTNANNISNISTNANNISNISTNANNVANISANANNLSNISTNANNISNISTNANNIANISTNANNLANISTNASNASNISKNVSNLDMISKNNNNISSLENNEENLNINQIQNENNFNISGERNQSMIIKKDDVDRNSSITNTSNNGQKSFGNLEDIMFRGVKNEGLSIENTSRDESLRSQNSNSINIPGEKKDNKELQVGNNQRQIIMFSPATNSTKMFQNTINDNNNNFSISSSNNNSHISNKTSVGKELNYQHSTINSTNKIEFFPSQAHNNSIYFHNYSMSFAGQTKSPKTKSELEEMRNNNSDYYSLFQEEYIQKKLAEENDKCTEFNLYSDQIFMFLDKKHISKRYIMLTPYNLYIIEPKEMRFLRVIKKENILSFQLSNKNVNIILFEINDGDNVLIETLRRMDLLIYLRDHFRGNKNSIKFKYADTFSVKIKGKSTDISATDKVFSNLSNFDGAQKIGYLLKKGKLFGKIFTEKLFILTSIGLLMFEEPSAAPKKLYPIIGSQIEKVEGNRYGRENCFKITFLSGKSKIFATYKKRERDSWLNEFKRITEEFQSKMKQIDTINKKIIDNSDKSLLPMNKVDN